MITIIFILAVFSFIGCIVNFNKYENLEKERLKNGEIANNLLSSGLITSIEQYLQIYENGKLKEKK